jgi:ankyrin repeat protein
MKFWLKFVLYLSVAVHFCSARADSYVDFFRAVERDDARTVAALLQRGFDPNAPNEKGQVAIILALRDDSPKVAAVLLAQPGLRIDVANRAGETPLMIAALRGQIPVMQQLLDRGGLVNREGWTPLHYAASGPEPEAVALLLARGAEIDALAPNRATPLMMAAQYGSLDGAALLLARGANPRLRNQAGLAAADLARMAGRDALAVRLDAAAR